MSSDQSAKWADVDAWMIDRLHAEDDMLEATIATNVEVGLQDIAVSETQGKFLMLMTMATGARRVLEIGTLGAYSTLWMARGMDPTCRIVSLEKDPHTAFVARKNIVNAGAEGMIAVMVGEATDSLQQLINAQTEPFDLVFIDANKDELARYFAQIMSLSHSGTVIIADNVVRNGDVVDPACTDANVTGIRQFIELAGMDPRVECTVVQTVGEKGYDGFTMCVVR